MICIYLILYYSSGSSGRMGRGRGSKQNEIYEAVFGGHFLMTYFYRGGHGSSPPCIRCCANSRKCLIVLINRSEILQISFVNVFSGLDVYLRFSRVLHVI